MVRRLSGPVAGGELKARKPRAPTEDGPSNVYIPALCATPLTRQISCSPSEQRIHDSRSLQDVQDQSARGSERDVYAPIPRAVHADRVQAFGEDAKEFLVPGDVRLIVMDRYAALFSRLSTSHEGAFVPFIMLGDLIEIGRASCRERV